MNKYVNLLGVTLTGFILLCGSGCSSSEDETVQRDRKPVNDQPPANPAIDPTQKSEDSEKAPQQP